MDKKVLIFTKAKFLLVFKTPKFSQLDFLDLVIDSRPIFLIAWEIKDGYRLKIKPLNTVYEQYGSLLLKLPENTQTVELIAYNFWKHTKKVIDLKPLQIDNETAAFLIQALKPVTTIEVKNPNVFIKNTKPTTEQFAIKIKSNNIFLKKGFKLLKEKFIYP